MTPEEIYAACRTDEGLDAYCRRFQTNRWLVKKSPSRPLMELSRNPEITINTPQAGDRLRIVAGLEHGGNFDTVHVSELGAEFVMQRYPDEWYIVDDRDTKELERISNATE